MRHICLSAVVWSEKHPTTLLTRPNFLPDLLSTLFSYKMYFFIFQNPHSSPKQVVDESRSLLPCYEFLLFWGICSESIPPQAAPVILQLFTDEWTDKSASVSSSVGETNRAFAAPSGPKRPPLSPFHLCLPWVSKLL